jgi:hypothetical protein
MSKNKHTLKSRIFRWEMIGIPLIFLAGALVHFIFEWTGGLAFIGIFAPVNESVWEHLKLGFWPTCLYAAIEWLFLRRQVNNFLTAKAAALFIVPVVILVVFYSYTSILGEELLAIDILSFLVAVALAQLISYKILTVSEFPRYIRAMAIVSALLLAVVLAIFSFYPPYLPIFMDSRGFYGIP